MKKLIIILGLLAMASASQAHHKSLINIEAHKVIIKTGMSPKMVHHHMFMAAKCLVALKKFKTAEEGIETVLAKIDEKCKNEKLGIDPKKCEKMKHGAKKHIAKCFMHAKILRELLPAVEAAK
jgi:hypothetical protein